jgi:flagellar biosynthesis protein FlhG
VTASTPSRPHLWALGGGKGGVGKSVIAALLAVALARRGRQVVAVDTDLGGANLHTLLGVPRPKRTLGEFLDRKVETLAETAVATGVDGLALISGARASLEVANLGFQDKTRLLRQLGHLDTDDVVLDLGGGTSFNVLDLFLCAHSGVVVVVAEPLAVEKTHHFLKAALLRKLDRGASGPRLRSALAAVTGSADRLDARSLRELATRVLLEDREAGTALLDEVASFRPALVVNCCDSDAHRRLGPAMAAACTDFFGSRVECLATLPFDPALRVCVDGRHGLDHLPAASPLVAAVDRLAEHGTVAPEDRRG